MQTLFYELGLRHTVDKPVIHIVHKSEANSLPFDVAQFRTISVSWNTPAEVRKSKEDLIAQVRATLAENHVVDNPVRRARGQKQLVAAGTSAEKALLEEMGRISVRVAELERNTPVTFINAPAPTSLPGGILGTGLGYGPIPISGTAPISGIGRPNTLSPLALIMAGQVGAADAGQTVEPPAPPNDGDDKK